MASPSTSNTRLRSPSPPASLAFQTQPFCPFALFRVPSRTEKLVDYLVRLCVGKAARIRPQNLPRHQALQVFEDESIAPILPPIEAEAPGWAEKVGGNCIAERPPRVNPRRPWELDNFGITFRSRYAGPSSNARNATNHANCPSNQIACLKNDRTSQNVANNKQHHNPCSSEFSSSQAGCRFPNRCTSCEPANRGDGNLASDTSSSSSSIILYEVETGKTIERRVDGGPDGGLAKSRTLTRFPPKTAGSTLFPNNHKKSWLSGMLPIQNKQLPLVGRTGGNNNILLLEENINYIQLNPVASRANGPELVNETSLETQEITTSNPNELPPQNPGPLPKEVQIKQRTILDIAEQKFLRAQAEEERTWRSQEPETVREELERMVPTILMPNKGALPRGFQPQAGGREQFIEHMTQNRSRPPQKQAIGDWICGIGEGYDEDTDNEGRPKSTLNKSHRENAERAEKEQEEMRRRVEEQRIIARQPIERQQRQLDLEVYVRRQRLSQARRSAPNPPRLIENQLTRRTTRSADIRPTAQPGQVLFRERKPTRRRAHIPILRIKEGPRPNGGNKNQESSNKGYAKDSTKPEQLAGALETFSSHQPAAIKTNSRTQERGGTVHHGEGNGNTSSSIQARYQEALQSEGCAIESDSENEDLSSWMVERPQTSTRRVRFQLP